MIQLTFLPISKEEQLQLDVKRLQETCDKVRKGLYAKNAEIMKMYMELYIEFEQLKKSICRGKN